MAAAGGGAVERWAFVADWTDPSSGVRWTYQLFAYLVSGAPLEVEMVRGEGSVTCSAPSAQCAHKHTHSVLLVRCSLTSRTSATFSRGSSAAPLSWRSCTSAPPSPFFPANCSSLLTGTKPAGGQLRRAPRGVSLLFAWIRPAPSLISQSSHSHPGSDTLLWFVLTITAAAGRWP